MITTQIKSLHELGFAIHWLQPKSKRPVELKWTSGARKTWDELKTTHHRGMNVGVRLGVASKIGDGYLAVIDCDVKSDDPKHVAEMEAKLKTVFGAKAPTVLSGRGNGSRHVYVLTREPVRTLRIGQSPEKVRVHMPSAGEPSNFEQKTLARDELKAGIRLRPAWEISLMGEGGQVVLPPSVHPDSGELYRWVRPLTKASEIPFFELRGGLKKSEERVTDAAPFQAVAVDLVNSAMDERTYGEIVDGTGVEDRSASLLRACNRMVKLGFSDNEILSVLTDEENFLGTVAYEHTGSESRARAAHWVRKYTLEKSKRETSAENAFEGECEIGTPLTDEEAAELEEEATPDPEDWRDLIERTDEKSGFRPKNTLKNVILILQGEGGRAVFKRDEFAGSEIYGVNPPWGGRAGCEFTDLDTIRIKSWLADSYRFEPSNDRINEAVSKIADVNRFHPVRDYLDTLTWDGVPRIDTWLRDYLQAGDSNPPEYLAAVSRKTLAALVARIYQPGAKFDYVLILEGLQGKGKSTALRRLVGDHWFTDATINVRDKDAIMVMRSKWLVELGELSTMRAADVEELKAFISRTEDRIRVPYGKRSENFPRQCIFVGTTNRDEYLKDPTGNRRYWPVKVGVPAFERISEDRDQLLAEAVVAYGLGELLYLDDPVAAAQAAKVQNERMVHDAWEDLIEDWIAGKESKHAELSPRPSRARFQVNDLFDDGGPLAAWKPNQPEMKRAADILRKMGFTKRIAKVGGRTKRIWERATESAAA